MKRKISAVHMGILFFVVLFFTSGISFAAEKYPSKPIRILVTKSIGGSTDAAIRLLQPFLQTELGVPVVLENNTSGGGRVAAMEVYKAQPDGHTLLCAPLPSAIVGQLMYDHEADFMKLTPLFNISMSYQTVTVAYDSKINSIKDLLEVAKTKRLNLAGSGGAGSNASIVYAKLKQMGITNLTNVPYPGAPETAASIIGGHTDISSQSTEGMLSYVQNKQLKILAVCAPERVKAFPNVPTFKELGYDFIVPLSSSIFGPPNMSADKVRILNAAFRKVLANDKLESAREKMGVALEPLDSEELGKMVKENTAMVKGSLAFIKEADEQITKKK